MLNRITEAEYEMLNRWRDNYAWSDEIEPNCETIPIREVLKEWESANQNLYKLLGNELIISKEINFNKEFDTLMDEMYTAVDHRSTYGRSLTNEGRCGWKFTEAFYEWASKTFPIHSIYLWGATLTKQQEKENEVNIPIRNALSDLISVYTLTKNVYDEADVSIPLPNGKQYVIRKGCKPVKALSKLAAAFDIPCFEDFRINHSLVHNQKKLNGVLTLSIHPLDYWTMSDNECGWESCMNWRDYGGYRQGTVEMMNSPCVVVAYLAAADDMAIGKNAWNNKKWRQLFIVHKDVILGIKSYPYNNPDLTNEVMKLLKDLAETNLGWEYMSKEDGMPFEWKYDMEFNNPNFPEEKPVKFRFCSGHMYTDVGCAMYHPIYVGKDVHETNLPEVSYYHEFPIYELNYSGASQCISCGQLNPNLYDSSYLCCDSCENTHRCSECGERIGPDLGYCVGDYCLCEYCYDEHTSPCSCCDDREFDDSMEYVWIMPRLNENIKNRICKKVDLDPPYNDYEPAYLTIETRLCRSCYNYLEQSGLKPGAKIFTFDRDESWGPFKGCYIDDLTEDALRELLHEPEYEDLINDVLKGKAQDKLIRKHFSGGLEWIKMQ